ncbi:MAG: hypothetical protein A2284_18095 [Deltaproteobacteria bacterium RIFOXYA12_FULL_61_11]|nr:MAG: hypothetical protein A2284_18095 [Deltaproteobacteria bacterium RIFOXYA12_FULL_61_11]
MVSALTVLVLLALGFLLARLPSFPRDASGALTAFVIHVSLPALILARLPALHFDTEVLLPILLPWLLLVLSAAAVLALGKLWRWPAPTLGALLLCVPLGNTSFLGLPLIDWLIGPEGVPYALLYDQLGSFLALSTYGAFVLAWYGGAARPTPLVVLRRLVTFPPFLALLAALFLLPFGLPPPAVAGLETIAASVVPTVMVAVGLQLSPRLAPGQTWPLLVGLSLKMVVAPALALALFHCFELTGLAARVSVLEAGMPPMITAGALALQAGFAPRLVAALLGLGIVLALATVPFFSTLL